ncbi:MAG: homoserine kinase [Anaerolineales bacterium]|nr:homoserine kinase [Anaerolineales bacterium]
MKRAIATVPATSANLGPGFDCLALALNLRNAVEIELAEMESEIIIEGEGEDMLPRDDSNLCIIAAKKVLQELGESENDLRIRMINRIPPGSGLGSSAAAIVGGMLASNALADGDLSVNDILNLALEFEGHPDNAAAALFGGLVIVSHDNGVLLRTVPVPQLHVVCVIPEIDVQTSRMRQILPAQVSYQDAVFNIGRTALTIEALRMGDYELMGRAMKDRLHQPYRQSMIPGYQDAETAALETGAASVVLSGAGPALIAFAPANHQAIAAAMHDAFHAHGHDTREYVLELECDGAEVSVEE